MSTTHERVDAIALNETRRTTVIPSGFDRLERLLWLHPEWWCVALSAGAWLLLLEQAYAGRGGMDMAHGQHESMAMLEPSTTIGLAPSPATIVHWLVMVVAMMLPLELTAARSTSARSLWRRHDRAISGFVAGYLLLWLIAGLVLLVLLAAFEAKTHWPLPRVAGVAFGLAAIWELTPLKFRALRACHRTTPLAPHGWRADRDCLVFGWKMGTYCLTSCWALMLACLLTEHSIFIMVLMALAGMMARYTLRPDSSTLAILYLKQATLTLLLGLTIIFTLTAIVS